MPPTSAGGKRCRPPTASAPPLPVAPPIAAGPATERVFCDQPVTVRLPDRGALPDRYRRFVGIWSDAAWTPQLCAALIVENVQPDGTASIVYVFGPMGSNARRAGRRSARHRNHPRRRAPLPEFGWKPVRLPPALRRSRWPSHDAARAELSGRVQEDPVTLAALPLRSHSLLAIALPAMQP